MLTTDAYLTIDTTTLYTNIWLKLTPLLRIIKAVYHTLLQTVLASQDTTSDAQDIPFLHKNDILW